MPNDPATPKAPKPRRGTSERRRQRAERRERVRLRRVRRHMLQVFVVLLVLLIIGGAGVTIGRHAILRSVLKPRIEKALGVEFTQGRFFATLGGEVRIEDPVWRAPGVAGEAGAVFTAESLTAQVNFATLVAGAGPSAVSDIEAVRPVIRLSQNVTTGGLNIDPIVRHTTGADPAAGVGAVAPPALRIVEGALEFGEHLGDQYTPLAQLRVEGVLEPPAPGEPVYELTLTELTNQQRPAMLFTGAIDLERSTASLTMRNLDLSNFDPRAAPSRVRELWSRLAIEGLAPRTEFHYSPGAGVEAELELAGVNLTTPAPIAISADTGPDTLRMQGVDGFIRFDRSGLRADLAGRVEDVDLRVELATEGFDVEGAFPFDATVNIEPFFFREGTRAALFAPPEAQEIIALFLGPQALVRGQVQIHRAVGDAGNVGDIAVTGRVTFDDGQMAYADFPYPIRDISGEVLFDTTGMQLRNLRGFGASGAFVTAEGEIVGYDAAAGLDIRINSVDTPVDDVLASAMPDDWRPIIDGLIDRGAYDRLRADGLLQSAADRDDIAAQIAGLAAQLRDDTSLRTSQRLALEREIDALGRRLRVPVFEPGGVGSADIRISRPPGAIGEFDYDIVVNVPKASLLPGEFPYPLIADPLRVVIRDEALIESVGLRGLTGGAGSGRIVVALDEDLAPDVDVRLQSLPIDALLRDVLPESPIALGSGLVTTPARLLEGLGLSGELDAAIRLDPAAPEGASLGATVAFRNLAAAPSPDAPALLTGLAGEAVVDGDSFRIGPVSGFVAPPSGDGQMSPARPAPLQMLIEGSFADESPSVEVAVTVDGLPLGAPVERIVSVFSPDAADALRGVRAERDPSGVVDASLVVVSAEGAETRAELALEDGRWLGFNTLGGRLTMQRSSGRAVIDLSEGIARLDRFAGSLLFDAQPAGRAMLDGFLDLSGAGDEDLTVTLTDARLESRAARAFARRQIGDALADTLEERRVRGAISGAARLRRTGGGARSVEGWVEPSAIAFDAGEAYIDVEHVDGRIEFAPGGGRLRDLRLIAEDWSVDIAGAWTAHEDLELDLSFGADAMGWPRPLLALLPAEATGALDAIDFRVDGPWAVRDGRIRAVAPAGDLEQVEGAVTAQLTVTDAAFFAGVDVDRAIGQAALAIDWSPRRERPGIDIDVALDSLHALGLALSDARAHLRTGDGDQAFVVEDFSADAVGGRLAGHIDVGAGPRAGRYDADLRLAGVDLGMLVASLASETGLPPGPTPQRGAVSGQLFLTGRLDDPASRIGRGIMVAEGGELVSLPFLLGVIELTNLQAPRGEELDYGVVEFSMQQDLVSIERMAAESPSIRVQGQGRLTLDDASVDLIFTSRGKRRVPLLSNLVDAVRNELIAARVTGTLADPRFRAQPLPSAGRVLEGALGATRSEAGMVGDSRRGESRRDRTTPTVPLNR
ncbi:MAG: AsmA-like C-terminal region-containing protein [Phycisphaerales bacterium]